MLNKEQRENLLELFKNIGVKAFTMSHYELHDFIPEVSTEEWKEFLTDPKVALWMKEELRVVQNAKINLVIDRVGKEAAKSAGEAQQLTALVKVRDDTQQQTEGNIFVYTYVPYNTPQKKAPGVTEIDHDPFIKEN